jgi:hypothetical protein
MSKIDKFKEQKTIYENLKYHLFNATARKKDGTTDSNNDKASLYIRYSEKHTPDWQDAILTLHASHGYYGSSSGYSDMDKYIATYMVKALNKHLRQIADEAIELARLDMEKARREAEEEAKEVLQEVL